MSWRGRTQFMVALAFATSLLVLITPGLASSAIAQRGTATTANANATTLTINVPTGVAAGDVMIAEITDRGGTTTTFPSLSGWTNVTTPVDFEGGGAHHRVALLYKIAGSSEPSSYTFSLGATNANAAGAIVAFSGVDTSGATPFDVTPGSYTTCSTGCTTAVSASAITTNDPNAAVVMFAASFENLTTSSYSTTSPGALTQMYGTLADKSGNGTVGAAWATKATAGSTGTGTATLSSAKDWAAILIALKPAVVADATQSTLTPTSSSITANGTATQVLTVQAKDSSGDNLTSGGATVTITKQSGTGSIGVVSDNGDGTYTATVTAPTATGSGVFVATLGGSAVKSGTGSQTQATVTYTPGAADASQSTLTPTSSSITANGTATQVLTVQAKDANGNNLTSGGSTVTITKLSGSGSISVVSDNGDGTYTATVTAPTATGSGVFVATLNTNPVKSGTGSQTQATVTYTPGPGAGAQSSISANPHTINADGSSTSTITVTVYDAYGNLTSGGDTVVLHTDLGSLGSVTDNGDGTYTTSLTSSATVGTAHITGTVNSETITTTDSVDFMGTFTKSSDVMINGQPTVGTTVTITNGVYSPTTTSRSYQWELCDGTGALASCSPIGGATSNQYTPVAGQEGSTLRVIETVSRAGYYDGHSTSDAKSVVKGSFTTSTAVAISGTPTVDTPSTITAGSYSPAPTSRTYQWRLCDAAGNNCNDIGGANSSSYTPGASDAGSTLRVVETVSTPGYNDLVSTSARALVLKGAIATNTAVAINGTPKVGVTSNITAGTYTPSPTGSSYQWERCDNTGANCSPISGATSNKYTPVGADAGSTLVVVETVTKDGYADGGSPSAASAIVANGSFSTNTSVSVSGTPTVGTASTVTTGSYSPGPSSRSYQWELCDSSGNSCGNITGANSSSYTPLAGDVGSTLRVVETATKTGYNNGGSTSSATPVVVNGDFAVTSAVAISGQTTVGTPAMVTTGVYSPAATTLSYQWKLCDSSGALASCSNIGGANSSSYTPVSGDVGSTLRVVETAVRSGYNNGSSTSDAVAVDGIFATNTAVAINGTPKVGVKSTTTGGTYTPSPSGRSYQWKRCDSSGNSCVAISGATYASYTPVAADVGKTLRVVETVTKSHYASGGSTSAASALVAKGTFVRNTAVAVVGFPKHGVVSKITPGSYTPTPVARTYKWLRCTSTTLASCTAISGATAKTYKPGTADIGKRLRVVETVSAPGYNNLSVTSAASTKVT
ncbi:MAG TPA: invasin domain 3-containing protein [Gaiellaceae bacterium]|nr:invasin domain 3-containing protein [Gaiellaceae bacterium]